ncbi:unnamed protein product [Triticum aestivum]|uniref:Ubiquitin-like protease family profile domain-containing protein n=1 Tax=Triticum aestivum TaxID=4565 RepID=A0A7H4LK31_WHEAT|nr:unnamed protein product [Triticum aestivum]
MDKINEFAWDGHFLAAALKEVKKYQKKREAGKSGFWIGGCLPMFAIIYMDFVDVPRGLVSEHRFNYSLPRASFVCNNDFKLLEEIDKNKLSLDKIEFGKRNLRRLPETPHVSIVSCNEDDCENNNVDGVSGGGNIPEIPTNPVTVGSETGGDVCGSLDEWLQPLPSSQDLEIPPHMHPLYEKHKKLHVAEVKNVMTSFGKIMQSIFCKRVARILVEANSIAATSKVHMSEGVTFDVPASNAARACDTRAPPQTSPTVHMGATTQEAEVEMEAAGTVAALDSLALEFDDGPSCSLFKERTEDFEWFNMDPETARKVMEKEKEKEINGVASPDVQQPLSAGPTLDNSPVLARQSNSSKLPMQYEAPVPCFDTDPKLQKSGETRPPIYDASPIAFTAPVVSSVQQDRLEAELHEPGEKIIEANRGSSAHVKKAVQNTKRKERSSNLYNKKKPKKFAFSVFMGSQLAMDPDLFDHKNCEREFRRACENNHISKSDLLFISVVQKKHWAVVVVNLLHKQFNVFDSVKNATDVNLLHKATTNVIANIKKVASKESSFHFDLDSFEKVTPYHPKQLTHYNCGFYAILFLENLDGVVMKHFDESCIPNLRKRIAADLIKHPNNTLDPADQLKKLLEL